MELPSDVASMNATILKSVISETTDVAGLKRCASHKDEGVQLAAKARLAALQG